MILVDSSVWIDFFNGTPTPEADRLDALLDQELLLIGDLILVEVLQGFGAGARARLAASLLQQLPCADLGGRDAALAAADNYRSLRHAGITARRTIDVIIATFCIRHQHRLLTSDRDFGPMFERLGLMRA